MRRAGLLIVLGLLTYAVLLGSPFRDSPNEKVIESVKDRYKNAPWMTHVTDWGSTLAISVKTDFPHDDIDSYSSAYEICVALTSEYAKNATDLPDLRIYDTDTTTTVKVDGSRKQDVHRTVIAEATSLNDYKCGITPPLKQLKEAKKLNIPVFSR